MKPTYKETEMKLPVKMGDEEYQEKAHELVDWLTQVANAEEKIAGVKDAYKDVLKNAKVKIEKLREDLKYNYVVKPVPVFEIYDWDQKTVYVRRKDTGDIVPAKFRKITDDDIQTRMDEEEADPKLLPSPEEIKEAKFEIIDEQPENEAEVSESAEE